ncbi:ABC transporter ATP-binding protein/permease [Gracilibacillus caseinilyticus]|uniref:ABC transporter ATP-binding protein/permease n=2 Tax=Gracilibacillus caseinilyticus TaxID=2932256 RepID=A0ABY4F1H5_9BACI|nr:ABC transporter ATP-binding protein [Gracilibacillus caseinilyticus]UOQ50526.1 ABC transporter ATP-binding protein/permease [Gracilibacillus caseinilyticus]
MKQKRNITGIKSFKIMIQPFLPSKWLIALALTLVLLQTCLSLIIPLMAKGFIDGLSSYTSIDIQTVILLSGVFLTQLISSSCSIYVMNYIGQYVVLSLRRHTWDKILRLPISYFDQHSSGSVMSRITNDTLIIKDFISSQLIPFISGLVSILGSIALLLFIDWKMTCLMLLIVPTVILVMIPLGKSMYKISKGLQDETASFQGDLGRVLTNIRLVKSFLAENQERATGLKRMQKLFHFGLKEGKIMAIIQPVTMSLMLLVLVVLFGYGSFRVSEGTLSAGSLVAIIFYMFQIATPFSQLTSFFAEFQKALGACERINYIRSTEPEINTLQLAESVETRNTLTFRNVFFSYLEDEPILHSINFQAEIGKVTAFIGPSGAGKTTIFSLIERFYQPNEGTITYKGNPIHSIPLSEWRHKIAYVSQDAPIMSGSIRSNLTYGLDNCSEDVIARAVTDANLESFIYSLPKRFDTEVGEHGIRLSGGQKQRLAIARAMIRDPEILLLDEATAHLDSNSEKLVQEALYRLMDGRTTIIIAHRLSTVIHADQLVVIENGTVTGKGVHQKLIEDHPFYQKLYEQQMPNERASYTIS